MLLLRRSAIRKAVFDTPLFHLCCWGARRYYDIWDLVVGRRLRSGVLSRSPYAAQWVR